MIIREVRTGDEAEWLRMRIALWPEGAEDHAREIEARDVGQPPSTCFVAVREDGRLCGFVEAATRAYADGCATSPVGYLEGLYVDPDARQSGVARALVEAAENWAIEQGYSEMGSDCLIDNDVSLAVHLALGYEERERIICFCKALRRTD